MISRLRDSNGTFLPHPPTLEALITKFYRYVDIKEDPDTCWKWKGERTYHGYGACRLRRQRNKGLSRLAHRLSYEIFHQTEIPNGLRICHYCDNPICVNPRHLFLGTDKDNSDDKVRKGRQSRGAPHSEKMKAVACRGEDRSRKLTNEDVGRIFSLRSQGLFYREIAEVFEVDFTCIYKIIKGKRWQHLRSTK